MNYPIPEPLRYCGNIQYHQVRWDPTRCCSGVVLDNQNYGLYQNVSSVSHKCVAGTEGYSQGKHYFQFRVVDHSANKHIMIGVSSLTNLSFTSTFYPGYSNDDGCSLYLNNGHVYYSNTNRYLNSWSACNNGDVIGMLLDLDNRTLTYFKNGGLLGCAVGSEVIRPNLRYFPVISLCELGHRVVSIPFEQNVNVN